MKKLYHFDFNLYYGQCEGVFAATDEEIQAAMGKELSFGEIEGKHSEVTGPLEEDDLEVLSDDPVVVEMAIKNNLCWGYNPLRYLVDRFDEDFAEEPESEEEE